MNVNDIYNTGSHLKANDLTRDVTVTISGHEVVDFDDGKKVVLKFAGKDKDLILNKTNASTIAEMHGADIGGWAGKAITIGPDRTSFSGRMVDCIRVRFQANRPAPEPAQAADEPSDDIPF